MPNTDSFYLRYVLVAYVLIMNDDQHSCLQSVWNIDSYFVVRFTAPVDVAKDAILIANETLTSERPNFELGQYTCSLCSCYHRCL